MNLLLDTHIALWAITDSPRLSSKARDLISSPDNQVWVSVASVWEIAIKYSLGRGDMPVSGHDAMHYFQESGYHLLHIAGHHAVGVERLQTHHNDPFDRILVAQALVEPMHLITQDPLVAQYSDSIIKV